jgi:hypothetical protein
MRKLRAGLEQVYGIAEAHCEFQGRIRVVQVICATFSQSEFTSPLPDPE